MNPEFESPESLAQENQFLERAKSLLGEYFDETNLRAQHFLRGHGEMSQALDVLESEVKDLDPKDDKDIVERKQQEFARLFYHDLEGYEENEQ